MTDFSNPGPAAELAVEMISAGASADACKGPQEDTLLDLALPPEAMRRSFARLEQEVREPGPTAEMLFDRAEDGFISALAITLVPGEWRERRRLAVVLRPFGFLATLGGERVAIVVPERFETDFASIPAWARGLISPFGRHAEPAVIHDWLYALGPKGDLYARRRADRIFRLALEKVGIGPSLRFVLHAAVRLGGKRAFGRADSMKFRELGTLDPVTPQPDIVPFRRTVAVRPVPEAPRAGS